MAVKKRLRPLPSNRRYAFALLEDSESSDRPAALPHLR